MQGLKQKISLFSKEVCIFSQQLSKGIDEITRTARSKPCIGPSEFKEGYEELVNQANSIESDISEIEQFSTEALSLEVLLGRCLAQLDNNRKQIGTLEAKLQEFGYNPDSFTHTQAQQSSQSEIESAEVKSNIEGLSPAIRDAYIWDSTKRRKSYSSPDLSSDTVLQPYNQSAGLRLPTVTPSPNLSSVPSLNSISPSFRDLQLKYGQLGLSESPFQQQSAANSEADIHKMLDTFQYSNGSPDESGVNEITADTLKSRLKVASSAQEGQAEFGASSSPMSNVRLPSLKPLKISNPAAGSTAGEAGPKGHGDSTPLGKQDIIAARLAAGEAPWDMLSLKAAINSATTGTGQIAGAVGGATFHPQAAAFTSLLHMCAKHRLWEKALEVFEAMKRFHPDVRPNTVHFSSLISACGTAGRWQEAFKVFEEMKEHSKSDPRCSPNVITYSALMTACCSAGRPDKANEAFQDMLKAGIKPDHISYSTLIAGYERWGDMNKAKAIFEEMKAAGLPQKSGNSRMPSYLEQFNRKLLRSNSKDGGGGAANEPGHRAWSSFASNATSDGSFIGAHYGAGGALSRAASGDLGLPPPPADDDTAALRSDVLRTRSPSHSSFVENAASPGQLPFSAAQHTPGFAAGPQAPRQLATPNTAQLLQAARGRRSCIKSGTPSPLSRSFDGLGHQPLPLAPPGFGSPLGASPPTPAFGSQLLAAEGGGPAPFDAAMLSQQLASTPGIGVEMANKILDVFVQQQMVQQALSPLPPVPLLPPSAPAPNGAPRVPQVTVQEYNNLPLRFSRQLSLDQMNEAVDYINALVEGKWAAGQTNSDADGVTPQELLSLELGNQRITALLNCLLQLKRVRLTVRNGAQFYIVQKPS